MINIVYVDEQFVLVSLFYKDANFVVGLGEIKFHVVLYPLYRCFSCFQFFVQDFQRLDQELCICATEFQAVSEIFLLFYRPFSL